ncbi:MAG TPA: hypothetical protein VIV60_11225 [Polyangiaceae bacterium]
MKAAIAAASLATFSVAAAYGVEPAPRGASDQRFWSRMRLPERDETIRLGIFIERLAARIEQAQQDIALTRRLYQAIIAAVEIAALRLQHCGELGFLVGHAYGELGTEPAAAQAWLECALNNAPHSALAFRASLELARLRSVGSDVHAAELAFNRAAGIARDDADWAKWYQERGLAYERVGQFEEASHQYAAWGKLSVDETSRALSGWYFALCIDRLGDRATAIAVIDAAESRAYERHDGIEVAVDLRGFRSANESASLHTEELRRHWLTLRRQRPLR